MLVSVLCWPSLRIVSRVIGLLFLVVCSQKSLAQFNYWVYDGEFTQLPDFNTLTPIASGLTDTISLGVTSQIDTFGLVFTRQITVPTTGNYIFSTTSDDGSKLYIDDTLVVDNDGLHGSVTVTNTIFLTAGSYQLRVEFFERTGGQVLSVNYRTGDSQFQPIPADGQLEYPVPQNPADAGEWGAVIQWPEIAISAANLPDGRVLTWSSTETYGFPSNKEFTHASIFDPVDESFFSVDSDFHDMFCAGISLLEDGTIVASGGNPSDRRTSSFDVTSLTWLPLADMLDQRWYGTNITLPNNQIFSSFAKNAGNRSEIYDPGLNTWFARSNVSMQTLVSEQNAINSSPNPSGALTQEWWAHLSVTPQGEVFQGGPTPTWHIFDPVSNTPNAVLGQPIGDVSRMYGNSVTYDEGKVILVGGADRRLNTPTSVNNVYLVDLNGATPVITSGAPMNYPRALSNTVMLPNGEVLVVGGNTVGKIFNDEGSVYPAEIYNPSNDTWRVVDSIDVPRNYHSTALLLKDGRVLSAGGGACGLNCAANHQDGQIFSPPYLFNNDGSPASRPEITDMPDQAKAGMQISISASAETVGFSIIRLSGTTHHLNTDQRFLPLSSVNNGDGTFTVDLPANPNVLILGNYWLFALNDKGTPSIGQTLQVVDDIPESTGDYRYFRFTPVSLRSNLTDAVQLAELNFYFNNVEINATEVLNPAGNNPVGEEPEKANDNSVTTKWLDSNKGALIYDFGALVSINAYNFITANDAPERDPVRWQLEASINGQDWDLVDDQSAIDVAVPVARGASTLLISIIDADGDGVVDENDAFPNDPTETTDSDNDGVGDNADEFPNDATETVDSDGDGVGDNADAFPNDPTKTVNRNVTPLPALVQQSTTMLIENFGSQERIWNVNPDNNTVSVSSLAQGLLKEISVGDKPWALAITPNQQFIYVTNKKSSTISVISVANLTVEATVNLSANVQPHGIVIESTGQYYYVVLEASAEIQKRRVGSHEVIASRLLSGTPRHLSLSYDEQMLMVSNFITPPIPGEEGANPDMDSAVAEIFVLSPNTLAITNVSYLTYDDRSLSESQGPGMPNYLGAPTISFDNEYAYIPSKKDNIATGQLRNQIPLGFDSTVRANTSRLQLNNLQEDPSFRVDHDNASVATSAALSGENRYLLVTLETSRELVVYNLELGFQLMRLSTGRAPQSVVFSATGEYAYVHNFMDRSISIFDLTELLKTDYPSAQTVNTISVISNEILSPEILLGKQLFYDAKDDRLARDNYMSCASCHKEAKQDGRVWDFTQFGEGVRNTISLRGRGGMSQGALHWSANFDELQDFEGQIRGFAGGTGLMSDADFIQGTRSHPLGDKKAGISNDLDALAAYLASLNENDKSPMALESGLSLDAESGRALFVEKGCQQCHQGQYYTDSLTGARHTVSSIKTASGQRLASTLDGLDTPTLLDVWSTAPYLHDGSSLTLSDAISTHVPTQLSQSELDLLVAYLLEVNESLDSDGDDVVDNLDQFPDDAAESLDSDGDGVGDNADAFPNDAGETADSDGDGIGDNTDVFPNDASETVDSDGDGVGDNADAFPNDAGETADLDGDGIGDNSDELPNDADNDRIPDAFDSSSDTTQLPMEGNRYIRVPAGIKLILGDIAFAAQHHVAEVSFTDIITYQAVSTPSVTVKDVDYFYSMGLYDFEVHQLSYAGDSVNIVIPQSLPLADNAVYRHYANQGWQTWVTDIDNAIASSPMLAGTCPNAGSPSYVNGLVSGYQCVLVRMQDGGPNDADGLANGVIQHMGGISTDWVKTISAYEGPSKTDFDNGSGDQLVLSFTVTNSSGDMVIDSLTLSTLGLLNKTDDIQQISIFVDADVDGSPDSDTPLSVNSYSENHEDLELLFTTPHVLSPGDTQFLIYYRF